MLHEEQQQSFNETAMLMCVCLCGRESEYIHTRVCVFVRVLEIGNIMFWLNEIKK